MWVLIAPKNNKARNYIILTPVTGNRLTDMEGYTGHNQQLLQKWMCGPAITTPARSRVKR